VLVEASLIDGLASNEIDSAFCAWQEMIGARKRQLINESVPVRMWPQHIHWNWNAKVQRFLSVTGHRILSIQCDMQTQGLMILGTENYNSAVRTESIEPIVYIHYIATAPWNHPLFTEKPRFGLIGKVFIAAAIHISMECGYAGRIGLHSLQQAESFYTACCMTDLGLDSQVEDLRYFEMTEEQAEAFIR
jgi:hypothetical protein